MKKGKYLKTPAVPARKRGVSTRVVMLMLALTLALGATIGGTLAWLTDKSGEVTNTFTVSNIDISLTETKKDFKMVPGCTVEKDPVVTVKQGSEACWLFVRVEESKNLSDYVTYKIAEGWTEYQPAGVISTVKYYYREVASLTDAAQDSSFEVLKDNKVQVREDVTKEMMDGLTDDVLPTLTFTAAAIQKAQIATVDDAWAKLPVEFTK